MMASSSSLGGGNSSSVAATNSNDPCGGPREELKSQFTTREGTYRLASAVEFARTTRPMAYVAPNTGGAGGSTPAPGTSPPVRISFIAEGGGGDDEDVEDNATRNPPKHHNSNSTSTNPHSSFNGSANSNNSGSNGTTEDEGGGGVGGGLSEKFCLNIGKELFVYPYLGIRKPVDMSKPIDKRIYKGTNPTCHDFNNCSSSPSPGSGGGDNLPSPPPPASGGSLMLLIGFSGGQIQLVDPISKEVNKLYNEERVIDKTRVTCIRWIPKSSNLFLVSHASGYLYLYHVDYPSGTQAPAYTLHKSGVAYSVSNCKSKTARNPLTRWTLGGGGGESPGLGAINEFAFSPCGQYLAAVSQDGFLRIFKYETCELVGLTRSYFGGLLCVCWSPDGKYVCVGGEDDLVTMWSFKERRVVARGQGHKSWVSVVAFDPVTSTYGESCEGGDFPEENGDCSCSCSCPTNGTNESGVFSISCDSSSVVSPNSEGGGDPTSSFCGACQNQNQKQQSNLNSNSHTCRTHRNSHSHTTIRLSISEGGGGPGGGVGGVPNPPSSSSRVPVCYRIGSVGQDTQICLWDLTEDVIKQPFGKNRRERRYTHTNPCPSYSSDNSSNINNCAIHHNYHSSNNVNHIHHHHHHHNHDGHGHGAATTPNNNPQSSSSNNPPPLVNGNVSSNSSSSSTSDKSGGHGGGGGLLSRAFGGALSFSKGDKDKEHKRNSSLGKGGENLKNQSNQSSSSNSNATSTLLSSSKTKDKDKDKGDPLLIMEADPYKLIGTQACPRLDECPLLEPLICKKISHERLTALVFREESIVTACQDGILCTWARPGDAVSQL